MLETEDRIGGVTLHKTVSHSKKYKNGFGSDDRIKGEVGVH